MKILVVCTGNRCRSQMAQGILQSLDPTLTVCSAGTRPAAEVHPLGIRVMQEIGIDISRHFPKSIDKYLDEEWDYVITVCGGAKESCPVFSGKVGKRLHIGFDDPDAFQGTEEEMLPEFRRVRDEIKEKMNEFLLNIDKDNELNSKLLNHDFSYGEEFAARFEISKRVAEHYAHFENAMSVLSNMVTDTSYICYGNLGKELCIGSHNEEVASIWEKRLMDRIYPDDMAEKIAMELRFHTFMNQIPTEKRNDYYLQHFLRMSDGHGNYVSIRHRIFYLDYDNEGNVLLTLCLYTLSSQNTGMTGIIDSLHDTLINESSVNIHSILSARECEILQQISRGQASKQIADSLCISINTVNNHRQNIIRKLHCQNTAEAVVVAGKLGLF